METRIIAKMRYLPSSGTTSDVGGMISTTSRKNTWRLMRIDIDRVTWGKKTELVSGGKLWRMLWNLNLEKEIRGKVGGGGMRNRWKEHKKDDSVRGVGVGVWRLAGRCDVTWSEWDFGAGSLLKTAVKTRWRTGSVLTNWEIVFSTDGIYCMKLIQQILWNRCMDHHNSSPVRRCRTVRGAETIKYNIMLRYNDFLPVGVLLFGAVASYSICWQE